LQANGASRERIICGVNENREFPDFLSSGSYVVRPSVTSPSSAMIVSHPSNLARLIDFYGGHIFDERDASTGSVTKPGIIDRMPDMETMRRDIISMGITNAGHFETMKAVYERYGIILDPHGAVGWAALETISWRKTRSAGRSIREADPGKFPEDRRQALV